MPVTCPFCRTLVEPRLDGRGQKVCPRCANRGPAAPPAATGTAPATAPVAFARTTPTPPATAPAAGAYGGGTYGSAWPTGQQAAWGAYPGPMYGQPGPGHWGHGPQQNAGGAVASMVLGIVAFFTSILGVIAAIIAVILGHRARAQIQASHGRLGGAGFALAGIILGWIYIGLVSLVILLFTVAFSVT